MLTFDRLGFPCLEPVYQIAVGFFVFVQFDQLVDLASLAK